MAFNETINTGVTGNDGKGAGLRTNMRKLIENDNYLKQALEDLNGNTPGVVSAGNVTSINPLDASLICDNSLGSIEIECPFFIYTGLMLKIDFLGTSSQYFGTLLLNLQLFNNPSNIIFHNAVKVGSLNFTKIRVGRRNGKLIIYIGELNQNFNFSAVIVDKATFRIGYSSSFLTGWVLKKQVSSFSSDIPLKEKTI